jgi:hypothetical protein
MAFTVSTGAMSDGSIVGVSLTRLISSLSVFVDALAELTTGEVDLPGDTAATVLGPVAKALQASNVPVAIKQKSANQIIRVTGYLMSLSYIRSPKLLSDRAMKVRLAWADITRVNTCGSIGRRVLKLRSQ